MSALQQLDRLAACIRQPDMPAPDGVDGERVAIYQELFFATLESALASGFPVLWAVLDEERRERLAREFLASHRCRTPFFLQIGAEFVAWLASERGLQAGDPPFLLELAHYERIELELDISQSMPAAAGWSTLARPLSYVWPVHRIGPDFRPERMPAQPTCLLVWRDAALKVRFMELAPLAFHLACRLRDGEPLDSALQALAVAAGMPCDAPWLAQGRALYRQWQLSGVIAAGD